MEPLTRCTSSVPSCYIGFWRSLRSSGEEEKHLDSSRGGEKYQELVSDCHRQSWKARCLPVHVGCRGLSGQSLSRAYAALGITGERRRRAIFNSTEAAEKASWWLWIKTAVPRLSCQGTSWRLINLSWVARRRVPDVCETQNTQWAQDTSLKMCPGPASGDGAFWTSNWQF